MNILMVLGDSSGFPPDIRIEKEAKSLIRAGHKVSLLCLKTKEKFLGKEKVDGIDVYRIEQPKLIVSGLGNIVLKAGLSSAVSPYWYGEIDRMRIITEANVLHIHDLPLVDTGLELARLYGLSLVADLHELYPDAIKAYYPWVKGRAINFIGRWEAREKRALEEADTAITISEPARDYYTKKYKLARQPVVVENFVDLHRWDSLSRDKTELKPRKWIMYAGSYNFTRGIDLLVTAMGQIVSAEPDAHLLLIGSHPMNILLARVPLSLAKHISSTGWVDDDLFPSFFAHASVLVHPIRNINPQIDFCCPHKLFEYMASGVPVVATHTRSFEDYILDSGSGFLFDSGDASDLADAILAAMTKPEYGAKGRRAVEEKYNWDISGQKLIEVYKKL